MFRPKKNEARILVKRGMPPYLLRQSHAEVEDRISSYMHSRNGAVPRTIRRNDQLSHWNTVGRNPCASPYIMCVSSEPNDLLAKLAAAMIMLSALRRCAKQPLWHTVLGGYGDPLLAVKKDSEAQPTEVGLYLFSNVTADSTLQKKETLRDLLETHSDSPRLVVTTGCDPLTFFNSLGLHLNYLSLIHI